VSSTLLYASLLLNPDNSDKCRASSLVPETSFDSLLIVSEISMSVRRGLSSGDGARTIVNSPRGFSNRLGSRTKKGEIKNLKVLQIHSDLMGYRDFDCRPL